jgi:hypothetical protein
MRLVPLVALLASVAAPAAAQDIAPAFDMTMMAGWTGQGAAVEQIRRETGTRLAPRSPAAARPQVSLAQAVAQSAFRPDPRIRAQVYARAVAMMQRSGAKDIGQFRDVLVSGKVRATSAAALARNGMSADNVVDTTALYLAYAWLAVHGSDGDPNPAQLRGVRQQVARAFAATPALLRTSPAVKQQVSESNIVQAALASWFASAAKANPKLTRTVRLGVAGWVRDSYQLDLTRMTLTANGLR